MAKSEMTIIWVKVDNKVMRNIMRNLREKRHEIFSEICGKNGFCEGAYKHLKSLSCKGDEGPGEDEGRAMTVT